MKLSHLAALLILTLSGNVNAQLQRDYSTTQTYPEQRFNVGMVLSDFLISRFKMEAEYRVGGPSALAFGVGTHLGYMDMDNRPFQSDRYLANDIYTDLGYKYYFARTTRGHFPFARINLAYQNTDIEYYEKDWVPLLDDGVRYYHYRDVQRFYHVENISVGMEMGIHLKGNVFFTDISFGAMYKTVISTDTPPEEFTTYNGGFFNDVDYEGVAPRLRIKMGFYLD